MKRSLICLMLLIGGLAFSQSDEVLDRLYMDDNAKTLETALIVLQAANILTEESEVEDAEAFLQEEEWGARILEDEEYISTGSFSLLVMKSFDLKSGLMYRVFPSRRYALKELVFQGYILGNPYLNDVMTSFNVIYTVSSLPTNDNINANYIYDSEEPYALDELDSEEAVTEEAVTEEAVTEEAVTEEAVTEEAVAEEVVAEEVVAEEVVAEEVVAEEVVAEEVVAEDAVTDEVTAP